ncbi:MAG TPA: sulfite exporter TauE/SafE family protein [Verrucomicrobiae bacterium]|nr:sulfite exporter TauE/SafE family protein [Verrucomicrobiae bacterium]
MQSYLLIMAAGFGGGFVNAIAGGGTLLTFPALLYSGLMPNLNASIAANATSTVAIWPGSLMSSWTYRRQLLDYRQRVIVLALPSLLGGISGAALLLNTPEKLFRVIVPYLILLACGLLTAQEPIGRWMTARAEAHPRKHAVALWLTQFAIAVYGGYFGAGIGILMLAAMAIFLPEDLQAANGMKNLFAVLINGIAAVYFIVVGAAVLWVAAIMIGAAILGGFAGAHTAQRLSPRLLRAAVVVFGLVVAVHLMMHR